MPDKNAHPITEGAHGAARSKLEDWQKQRDEQANTVQALHYSMDALQDELRQVRGQAERAQLETSKLASTSCDIKYYMRKNNAYEYEYTYA